VNIENDYKALDMASNRLKTCIEKLIKIQSDLIKDTNTLYEAGFQDIKFQELKAVIDDGDKNLTKIVKTVQGNIVKIEERSKLIKTYYSVMK